jgi:RsiW-degrading membrane proteinase PrsW (M82 family)
MIAVSTMTQSPWPVRFETLSRIRFGARMRTAATCLVIAVAMMIATGLLFIFGVSTGSRNLLLSMLCAVGPVPMYIAITLWLDRFEAEPLWMLSVCFIWGTTAAALISLVANQELVALLNQHQQLFDARTLSLMIVAPVVEELAKGAILLILFIWKHHEFDGVLDGIIYATMVSLGFAMTENIVYYARAMMEYGQAGITNAVILRGMIFPFMHPLFTSFLGIGLGMAAVSRHAFTRQAAPAIGLTLAIVLHMLWNVSTLHNGYFVAGYLFVSVPVMMGIVMLIFQSLRGESKVILEHLRQEVEKGQITPAEHHRLGRIRKRFFHDMRCLLHHGPAGFWASVRFHQAATELAFHRHHAARGRLPHDPLREQEYLRHLELLRPMTQCVKARPE